MLAKAAQLWDRIPVKGPMIAIVAAVGAVLALTAPGGKTCNDSPLRHVYRPSRLQVLAKCQTIRFRVVAWRLEHDGDYHVNGRVLGDSNWVNPANVRLQHGYTVVEFVPHDPRPPRFLSGETLTLTVTKVADRAHGGWIEAHPVFSASVENATGTPINPSRLASPTEPDP